MGFNRTQQRNGAAKAAWRTRTAQAGTAVVFCGLLALGGSPRVHAEAAPALPPITDSNGTISMRIVDADIHAVVNFLQGRTRINVIVVEGEHPYNHVNVFLKDASPDKALAYIAASAGAVLSVNPDGVYILHPASSQAASTSPDAPAQPQYKSSDFRPYKLYLKHVSPDEVLKKLEWTQTLQETAMGDVENEMTHRGSSISSLGSNLTVFPQANANYGGQPYQQPTVPAGHGSTGLNQANDSVSADRSVDPSANTQAQQFPGFGGGGFGGGNTGFGGGIGGGNTGFGGGIGGGFPGGGGGSAAGAEYRRSHCRTAWIASTPSRATTACSSLPRWTGSIWLRRSSRTWTSRRARSPSRWSSSPLPSMM